MIQRQSRISLLYNLLLTFIHEEVQLTLLDTQLELMSNFIMLLTFSWDLNEVEWCVYAKFPKEFWLMWILCLLILPHLLCLLPQSNLHQSSQSVSQPASQPVSPPARQSVSQFSQSSQSDSESESKCETESKSESERVREWVSECVSEWYSEAFVKTLELNTSYCMIL